MEPPSIAALDGPRRPASRPRSLQVANLRTLQGALVGAGLAAACVGLVGVEAGLVWVVAGVWTVRRVWGRPPGLAWGIACLAAGFRWGTLGLADVEAATRLLGPTVAAGPPLVVAGGAAVLVAAVVEESAADGLRAASWGERAAAALAMLALVPAFCAPGPGRSSTAVTLGWWAAAGAALGLTCLGGSRAARRLPAWLAPAVAAAGTIAMGAGT